MKTFCNLSNYIDLILNLDLFGHANKIILVGLIQNQLTIFNRSGRLKNQLSFQS